MRTMTKRGAPALLAASLLATAGCSGTTDVSVQAVQKLTAASALKWRIANDDGDASIGGPPMGAWLFTPGVPSDMTADDLATSATGIVLDDHTTSSDATQTHILVMTSPAKAAELGRGSGWAYCHQFVLWGGLALEDPWPDGTKPRDAFAKAFPECSLPDSTATATPDAAGQPAGQPTTADPGSARTPEPTYSPDPAPTPVTPLTPEPPAITAEPLISGRWIRVDVPVTTGSFSNDPTGVTVIRVRAHGDKADSTLELTMQNSTGRPVTLTPSAGVGDPPDQVNGYPFGGTIAQPVTVGAHATITVTLQYNPGTQFDPPGKSLSKLTSDNLSVSG